MNFYELLGIKCDASKDEIKSAYRSMAKKYHPDVCNDENSNLIIKSLNEAKEVLLDDDKRRNYDQSLEAIKFSKTFSYEENETYKNKSQEHHDMYSNVYVTKWEFYVHYLKISSDNFFVKLLKSLLSFANLILFNVLRCIVFAILYLFFILDRLIDYFAVFLFIIATLFLLDFLSFKSISNDIFKFSFFSFLGILLIFIKIFVVRGSTNLIAILFNLEDSIFVRIINL